MHGQNASPFHVIAHLAIPIGFLATVYGSYFSYFHFFNRPRVSEELIITASICDEYSSTLPFFPEVIYLPATDI